MKATTKYIRVLKSTAEQHAPQKELQWLYTVYQRAVSLCVTMCSSSPSRMVALTEIWSSLLVTTSTRPYRVEKKKRRRK
jgi:hypothetical protein